MKKVLSAFLVFIFCFVSIFTLGEELSVKAYTSHTVEEAVTYLNTLVGKKVGSGQCVALIVDYYQYLGVPRPYGNGKDYATNTLPSGWSRIKGAQPQKGDIMIWTGTTYGHVAICGGDGVYFHQNWDGLYVSIKNKSYTNGYNIIATGEHADYWGVIRPDFKNKDELSVSNPWIKVSKSGLFLGENVSFTFGADNATSYKITIKHLDEVVKTEDNVKSGVSYTFSGEGSYTAYITAQNGSASIDSATVGFYVVDALDMGSYFIAKLNNPASGLYVSSETLGEDVSSKNVYLSSESANNNKEWKFIRQEDYSYKVVNVKTGYCLNVSGGKTDNGTNIDCSPDNGTDAQRWFIRRNLSGYALVPKLNLSSDLSITGNGWIYNDCIFDGANISLYSNDSVQSQRFVFEYTISTINEWISIDKAKLTSIEKLKFDFGADYAREYILHAEFSDGSFLEKGISPGDSVSFDKSGTCTAYIICILEDGTEINTETVSFYNMKIYDLGYSFRAKIKNTSSGFYIASEQSINNNCYNTFIATEELCSNNIWIFNRQTDGSYKITNEETGYVLDLYNKELNDKTNIVCSADDDSNTQRWFITTNINGYAFVPKDDYTKYLSIYDHDTIWWYGEHTDGANILLYDLDNVQSQRFKIIDYEGLWASGDIDSDNDVNTSDLALMKLHLAGARTLDETGELAGDIDANGEVDTSDLALLKLHLAGARPIV